MREVIEYRAVQVSRGWAGGQWREEGAWTTDRLSAELGVKKVASRARTYGDSPGDLFLERRTVTYGEPERVKEGEGDAV